MRCPLESQAWPVSCNIALRYSMTWMTESVHQHDLMNDLAFKISRNILKYPSQCLKFKMIFKYIICYKTNNPNRKIFLIFPHETEKNSKCSWTVMCCLEDLRPCLIPTRVMASSSSLDSRNDWWPIVAWLKRIQQGALNKSLRTWDTLFASREIDERRKSPSCYHYNVGYEPWFTWVQPLVK